LARALVAADVDAGPEAAVEAWGIATLAVACVSGVVAPSMLVPALALCGFGAPFSLHVLRRRHERHFAAALPMALEQVAAELRGGGTVAGAVQRLGSAAGPVAHDLARVHARTRLGLGLVDALASWPREHDAPGVRAAAGALAVAAGLGGRAADAIDGSASSLRHRLDAAAEARALSTQARTSAIVVGAAPLGYLAFASVVDPSSVDALTTTGVGRVCLVVGVALEALAALWIRRIVTAEPS
jgi:tight adherence protein B